MRFAVFLAAAAGNCFSPARSRYYALASGQVLIPLLFVYLAVFSMLQRLATDALRSRTGSATAAAFFGAILAAWFIAAVFPLTDEPVFDSRGHERNMRSSAEDLPERSAASGWPAPGFQVTIYDERLAWEKPCGGGLTHKAIEAYPFLLDSPQPKKIVRTAELISSSGHRAQFEMSHPIVIYARKVLNGLLLDRADRRRMHGGLLARHQRKYQRRRRVRLMAGGEERCSDFVVLAAGARNQLLPETTALGLERSGSDARLFRSHRRRHHQGEISEAI